MDGNLRKTVNRWAIVSIVIGALFVCLFLYLATQDIVSSSGVPFGVLVGLVCV